ncbi:MAG TPA: sulfatase [Thermoanaerobaculia bacterium]|nr:sulfatase [Thermoanaerobaculia bacterium]
MFPRLAVLLLPLLLAASMRPEPAVRHIVVLSVDTLRADAVSPSSTPSITALARDSVVFTRAFSPAPWTLPALASAMTGVSPQVHQATGLGGRVPGRLTTLAEALRRAGFRTEALVSNPVLGPGSNLSQGFREYTAFPSAQGEAPPSPPRLAELAAGRLREHGKENLFLWVHFFDPHAPWEAPPEYLGGSQPPPGMGLRLGAEEHLAVRLGEREVSLEQREWMKRLYAAEVRWVDDAVGSLLAEMKRLGIYDDSLIVLLSDHGEELWEHGTIGHGHTLYDELLHVPFLVKLPGAGRKGEIDAPVSTASLPATILDLRGAPLPAGYPAARSLRPFLAPNATPLFPEPLLATGLNRVQERQAVRFGTWKAVRWLGNGREELYDLARDPGERNNLASASPPELAEARRLLAAFEAESRKARARLRIEEREEAPLDSETLKRLRALGYGR